MRPVVSATLFGVVGVGVGYSYGKTITQVMKLPRNNTKNKEKN